MTTMTAPAPSSHRVGPAGFSVARFGRYYAFSLGTIVRDWSFLVFIIAMPVTSPQAAMPSAMPDMSRAPVLNSG